MAITNASYEYLYTYKKDDSDALEPNKNSVPASSVLVSEVKKSANNSNQYSNIDKANPTTEPLMTRLGLTNPDEINNFYKTEHTLTFYFMERGMWESNMRIQFNFPEHDTFEVGKTVDTATNSVDSDFVPFFKDESFDFTMQNLVTHYGAYDATQAVGYIMTQSDVKDYGSALGSDGQPGTTPERKNINGAEYVINNETTKTKVGADGKITLKSRQTALFKDQFRRGSYLSLTESANKNDQALYTSKWKIYEDGMAVTSYSDGTNVKGSSTTALEGTGRSIKDNRTEQKNSQSGRPVNDYTNAARPAGDVIVFRSYSNPDSAASISLKADFTNTVNTGSLTISKAQAQGSENLTGTYTFYVVFSDIGGKGLTNGQDSTVTKGPIPIKAGSSAQAITGIPVNTTYTIYEINPTDGSTLSTVSENGVEKQPNTGKYGTQDAKYYSGKIEAANTTTKGENDRVVFTNTKSTTTSLLVTKKWTGLNGFGTPDSIFIQIQRTTTPNVAASWQPVTDYKKYEIKKTDLDDGWTNYEWKKTISGLEAKDKNGTPYTFRVLEYESTGNTVLQSNDGQFNHNIKVNYTNNTAQANTQPTPTVTVTNNYQQIVMPETGGTPFVINYTIVGILTMSLAGVVMLIYKKKMQKAIVNTKEKGRNEEQ